MKQTLILIAATAAIFQASRWELAAGPEAQETTITQTK